MWQAEGLTRKMIPLLSVTINPSVAFSNKEVMCAILCIRYRLCKLNVCFKVEGAVVQFQLPFGKECFSPNAYVAPGHYETPRVYDRAPGD